MRRRRTLKEQVIDHAKRKPEKSPRYEGDTSLVVSTGSTLLDLAITGGRIRGGGIPVGILIEISGPASSGKTVMLCVIAGNVVKLGGMVKFRDPESRLDKQFARIFGMHIEDVDYDVCRTVPEVFSPVKLWKPKPTKGVVHAVLTDSLAALSTDMELKDKDKTGMRRAKEFSEECRKTHHLLKEKNMIMVCSNQLRQNVGGGDFAPKYTTPGGEAIGFYSSLRLRTMATRDIPIVRKVRSEKIRRVVGVDATIRVIKSSVWKPKREATVPILYDKGINDVGANLKFIKRLCGYTEYRVGDEKLSKNVYIATKMVNESKKTVKKLREEVIDLWEEIEAKFEIDI